MGPLFRKLPTNYQRFVTEYLLTENLWHAAEKAGSKAKNLSQAGKQLLKKAEVQDALDECRLDVCERLGITQESVLGEIAKIGFGNMKNLYDGKGFLKPVHELDDDVTATLQEVTEDTIGRGEDEVIIRRKYKTSCKRASLELLGKRLKLFTDKHEHSGPGGGPIQTEENVTVTFVGVGEVEKEI